jgi:hypothetical protein
MRSSRLLALTALALGAATFLPMLGNSFYRDDFAWVERAIVAADDPARWVLLAGTDFRPLASLSFMLNLAASGLDPAGYYAFNLALHLAIVALLMLLALRLTGGDFRAAGIAGMLFAVALGNWGEAVYWICGRTGPIADLFMLAALVLHWDWREHGRPRDRVLALAAFALALLGKESAAILLPLLVLLDWVHAGRAGRGTLGPRPVAAFLPHAVLLAAYLAFQFGVWRRSSPILENEYALGLHAAANLREYLARMFVPINPGSMFIAASPRLVPALAAVHAVLGWVVPLALGALLASPLPRPAKFALAWIPLTILPVVFFTYRTSARYLYAPSMGLALALGMAGAWWWARTAARRAPGATARLRIAGAALLLVLVAQGAIVHVLLRRHAQLERAEGDEPWARLRAVARAHRPATEVP